MSADAESAIEQSGELAVSAVRASRMRWLIVSVLFLGAMVNYIDRTVLSTAAQTIKDDLHMDIAKYGYVAATFSWAYMLAHMFGGWIIDRFGTRKGYTMSLIWWSIACMTHALARSPLGFATARAGLAIGEAGCWPGSAKAIAEWFPRKERPVASGIFDSGSKAGMVLSPVIIAAIIVAVGWRHAFVLTGILGLVLILPLWLLLYRRPEEHKLVNEAELAYINQNDAAPAAEAKKVKVPWWKFLCYRQYYGIILFHGSISLAWMVMQNYLTLYFQDARGLGINAAAIATSTSLVGAVLGNILGGLIIGKLMSKFNNLTLARMTTVVVACILIAMLLPAVLVSSKWLSVAFIGLCGFGFSMASTNNISMAGDFVPKSMVASFWGFIATGSMALMILPKTFLGVIVEKYGWVTAFGIPAIFPILGIFGMFVLVRKVEYLPGIEELAGGPVTKPSS